MSTRNLYIGFVAVTLLVGLLIISKVKYYNYLSIVYSFILYPFYIRKCLRLAFKVSSYIKENHPPFYLKHKTLTNSFLGGKIVSLDKGEILKLEDKIVLDYYIRIRKYIMLMFLTFLFFFIFSVMIVLI